MKPYLDEQFDYKNRVLQIQIWGHPERALLLITPLQPSDLPLDSICSHFIEGLSKALVKKFCLDPFHLIFILTRSDCKVEDSYVQVQLRWESDKLSNFQHHVSVAIMNYFMRQGIWLGESTSFLL